MVKSLLGKAVAIVFASVCLLDISASADVIKLTGVGGNNEGGVYTVPYYLSINGGANQVVMCDDYTHDVVINETWQGTVYNYNDLATMLAHTRAGAPVALGGLGLSLAQAQQDYREMFWLFSQFLANPAPNGNITADHVSCSIGLFIVSCGRGCYRPAQQHLCAIGARDQSPTVPGLQTRGPHADLTGCPTCLV